MEFVQAALANLENGWQPLPCGRVTPEENPPKYKAPWFKGLIGYHAKPVTPDDVTSWPAKVEFLQSKGVKGVLSLGSRCPPGRIGIDIDHYGPKTGLDSLAELELLYGPLPPAPVSTARDYQSGSGIRLFSVPADWRGKTLPADHIELVQWFHRFIVSPPSLHHTGRNVKLYNSSGALVPNGILPAELPKLPDSWLEGLAQPVQASAGVLVEYSSGTAELVADFAKRYVYGVQPYAVQWVINSTIRRDTRETRNPTLEALCWAAREAKGYRYPWRHAMREIRCAARQSYAKRGKSLDQADWDSLVAYAVSTVRDLDEQTCWQRWQA